MPKPDPRPPLAAARRTLPGRVGGPLLLVLCLAAGCGHAVTTARVSPAVPAAAGALPVQSTPSPAIPPGMRVGVVRVIGNGQRFVLVQVPSLALGAALPDGQTLACHGAAPATLRVSRERRPPFVVADVVAGEPRVGDEVFIAAAAAATAPAPSPAAPVTPTPAALPDFRANPVPPPTF